MNQSETQNEKTRRLLTEHFAAYPKLQAEDIFKFLYQSAFGCEHLVSCEDDALTYIEAEYKTVSKTEKPHTQALDGDYSRVFLSHLNSSLSARTLARLFSLSAKKEEAGKERLEQSLSVARELVFSGDLPLECASFEQKLSLWRDAGYPPVRHSATFRQEYRPAYRVIANAYAKFLPLFSKIDEKLSCGRAVVAIEGGSASGKTTLSELLRRVYDCNVIHADDFFLRPEQRTSARFAEVGGNFDRERFSAEVVQGILKKEAFSYRPFDCSSQSLGEEIRLEPKPLTIVEGVYSTHPFFDRYYDFSIFLDIDKEIRKSRIQKRNSPPLAKRFFEEWIPYENVYFEKTDIKGRSDLVFSQGLV